VIKAPDPVYRLYCNATVINWKVHMTQSLKPRVELSVTYFGSSSLLSAETEVMMSFPELGCCVRLVVL